MSSLSLRRSSYDREDKDSSSRRRHSSSHSKRSRSRSISPVRYKQKKNENDKIDRRRRTGWDKQPSDDEKGGSLLPSSCSDSISLNTNALNSSGWTAGKLNLLSNSNNSNNQNAISNISLQAIQNKALCRIYVGSLDYYLTELEIKQVFQAFGTIVAVDMPKEGNRSKGFCFIEYTTPEAASLSLKTMQGFVLKGRSLKIGRPTAVGAQMALSPTISNGTIGDATQAGAFAAAALFAPKSGNSTLPIDISSIVEKVGDTAAAGAAAVAALGASAAALAVARGGGGGGEDGLRATAVASAASAAALISQNNNNMSYQTLPNRIYVGNIPINMGVDDIKKIFSVFGVIHFCQLITNPENPNTHRGYGFIEYTTTDEAQLAIKAMNKFELGGRVLKVNYATALRSNNGTTGDLSSVSNVDLSLMDSSIGLANENTLHSDNTNVTNKAIANQLADGNAFASSNSSSFVSSSSPFSASTPCAKSRVIMLCNMVTPEEVDDDLKEEIYEECSRYGEIETVQTVPEITDVKIFVCFKSESSAAASLPNLHKRWFGGKQIYCKLYDENAFFSNNFNL